MAARIEMMATTIRSSMSVNPDDLEAMPGLLSVIMRDGEALFPLMEL
jgi:hypothetical protein